MSTPPDATRPRRGRPGHDQEAVIRKAIEIFNQRGYDATSMEELARELGLTKSGVYHHVPSKAHLLQSALDEGLGALERVIDAAAADREASAYQRLRSTVSRSVEVLVEHLPSVTLVLRVRGNTEVELEALRRRRLIDARFATLVRAAVAEGTVRGDLEPELASRLLFGMVNSITEWYDPAGPVDAPAIARVITVMAFDGLSAPGRGAG